VRISRTYGLEYGAAREHYPLVDFHRQFAFAAGCPNANVLAGGRAFDRKNRIASAAEGSLLWVQ
jgi:hypothetical protein